MKNLKHEIAERFDKKFPDIQELYFYGENDEYIDYRDISDEVKSFINSTIDQVRKETLEEVRKIVPEENDDVTTDNLCNVQCHRKGENSFRQQMLDNFNKIQ